MLDNFKIFTGTELETIEIEINTFMRGRQSFKFFQVDVKVIGQQVVFFITVIAM